MPKGKSGLNRRLFEVKGDLNEEWMIEALGKVNEEKNLEIQVWYM